MKEAFTQTNFREAALGMLEQVNSIIDTYLAQRLRLTLRQLYYQLVTRNTIRNEERAYKNLGNLVSQGRLAGLVDWQAIVDRLRVPHKVTEWTSPMQIMEAVVSGYLLPRWERQPRYVELWVEKDALAGVLEPIADQYHITLMVNRGYSSSSAMKEAAERLLRQGDGKTVTIFYVGDFDPSGEDMVRDVEDRLLLLTRQGVELEVIKLAITQNQIAQYNPPPNPAKLSDSRAAAFIAQYGDSSYEVDALPPDVLSDIVRGAVEGAIDPGLWRQVMEEETLDKALLQEAADQVMRRRRGRG